jgi:hypothetical protein
VLVNKKQQNDPTVLPSRSSPGCLGANIPPMEKRREFDLIKVGRGFPTVNGGDGFKSVFMANCPFSKLKKQQRQRNVEESVLVYARYQFGTRRTEKSGVPRETTPGPMLSGAILETLLAAKLSPRQYSRGLLEHRRCEISHYLAHIG